MTISSTEGATIYYTTNGVDPTTNSSIYSTPIAVNTNTTIKAMAVKDNMNNSNIATAAYTIQPNKPTITNNEGVVSISADENLAIYYTTDGNDPTTTSNLYSNAFSPNQSCTIKAIAVDEYNNYSEIVSANYIYIYRKNINSNYFVKVTDASALEAGDAIIIVDKNNIYALGADKGNNREAIGITPEASNGIIDGLTSAAQKIILVPQEDCWYLYTGEGKYLYAASSSSNYLKTTATPDANAKSEISISNGNATIKFQGSNTRNLLRYNSSSTLFSCYGSGQEDVQIYKEVVKPVVTVANPTFSLASGVYFEAKEVMISCETEEATIKYSTDGETWNDYSSALTISEPTTLYAKAIKGEDESAVANAKYNVIITTGKGTEANPFNVADANKILSADVTLEKVYVKGIVSQIDDINTTQYYNATYYISDDGSTDNQFYVYRGKNLANSDFTSEEQLQKGDEVVVYGDLTIYGSDKVFEFKQGNYIVSLTRPEPVELAKPIIFHDGGTYEQALKVAIAGQGTIKYKLNGGAEQTYSTPIDVNETTTITAWVEQDGSKSKEISKTFTIETKEAGPTIEDGYYTIKNNGNGKYVNVAGRRTVTFVDEAATDAAPGTVIKVKATDGQLEVLRSQGVDIPGYAQRAMNYVPALVKAIVERLGENNFIGEPGLNNVANEFTDKFDYHLYLEKLGNEGNNYRIYGKTPSMTPVVDFYAKNKEVIDGRLPYLEGFVKDIFTRIADKLGRGQGWVDSFKIHDLWVKMGGTESGLTEPVDEDAAAISQFYTEILSSEKNVWNFAHETMMIYWGRVKEYINDNEDIASLIGDYSKYIDKVEYIQPDFKYYIVQKDGQMDFISEGNTAITTSDVATETDFTAWKLEKRSDFNVTFNAENTLNGDKELYTTLYTDFAYTLPDDVKAYAVTSINKKTGVAVKKEITGVIPAQTPVLLKLAVDEKVTENQTQTLTLSTEAGTAPETNLLVGPDYLINEYKINAPQVESMLSVLSMLSQSLADQYEYLKRKNAGTVNNKYFFGLTEDDLLLCTFKNEDDEEDCVVRNLSTGDQKLGFYNNWEVNANKAFLVSEEFDPIKLTLLGDVNRDGVVNVTDVSATVDISLGKATPETHSDVYDFDAADADESGSVDVTDAVIIVNISLGK
ncbi:MAG: chitobiase/beta-hexosaminidase C-terminal domain-containing protein [Prevotella sp.]|nr:chitobiase/beta-hexosaminidase C-terminal domain-containing protein [Prevotella sp.]